MRWSKPFRVVAPLAALVLSFVPARSQQLPADITIVDENQQKSAYQSLKDFSSYGASFGVVKIMGGDMGQGAIRPLMQGVFRYRFSDRWIGVGEFGYGWNAYGSSKNTQTQPVLAITYGTLGAARRFSTFLGTDLRSAAGLGFYRWDYKSHGASILDSYRNSSGEVVGTQRPYRGMSPGGYIGLEGERRIARHVTVVGLLQQHYILTKDSEKFSRLFDSNHPMLGVRIGVNYHFSPNEGILWERKGTKKLRLESGKDGK